MEGLDELKKVTETLMGVMPMLDKFKNLNMNIVPEQHRHLLENIDTKSLPELEELKKQIEKLGA